MKTWLLTLRKKSVMKKVGVRRGNVGCCGFVLDGGNVCTVEMSYEVY